MCQIGFQWNPLAAESLGWAREGAGTDRPGRGESGTVTFSIRQPLVTLCATERGKNKPSSSASKDAQVGLYDKRVVRSLVTQGCIQTAWTPRPSWMGFPCGEGLCAVPQLPSAPPHMWFSLSESVFSHVSSPTRFTVQPFKPSPRHKEAERRGDPQLGDTPLTSDLGRQRRSMFLLHSKTTRKWGFLWRILQCIATVQIFKI